MFSVDTHRYQQVGAQQERSVMNTEIHLVVVEVPPEWDVLLSFRACVLLLYQPVLHTGETGASQGGCGA